jgi:hypothetical protein
MKNIENSLKSEHPEDIPKIRALMGEKAEALTDSEVGLVWRGFSHAYAASWLHVGNEGDALVEQFKQWIQR